MVTTACIIGKHIGWVQTAQVPHHGPEGQRPPGAGRACGGWRAGPPGEAGGGGGAPAALLPGTEGDSRCTPHAVRDTFGLVMGKTVLLREPVLSVPITKTNRSFDSCCVLKWRYVFFNEYFVGHQASK